MRQPGPERPKGASINCASSAACSRPRRDGPVWVTQLKDIGWWIPEALIPIAEGAERGGDHRIGDAIGWDLVEEEAWYAILLSHR